MCRRILQNAAEGTYLFIFATLTIMSNESKYIIEFQPYIILIVVFFKNQSGIKSINEGFFEKHMMLYFDLVLVKINEMTLKVPYQKFANSYIKIEPMYIVKQKPFWFFMHIF